MGVGVAFVVHPELRFSPSKRPAEQMLAEAGLLAETIGLKIGHAKSSAYLRCGQGHSLAKA